MRRLIPPLALFVLTSTLIATQTPTTLSGKWNEIPQEQDTNQALSLTNGSWSSEVTLTQDPKTLVIEYVSSSRGHAAVRLVYNLDGTETTNLDRNSIAPQERLSRAAWRGATLVLMTVMPRVNAETKAAEPMETIEELSIESPGILLVKRTRSYRGQTATAKFFYKRQQ
jgi:hypothetical protein